jgi:hypothetical protein
MANEVDVLKARFDNLFENEGLTNVKFFVRNDENMTMKDFLLEVNQIQETIENGDFEVVEALDSDIESRKFNDAY